MLDRTCSEWSGKQRSISMGCFFLKFREKVDVQNVKPRSSPSLPKNRWFMVFPTDLFATETGLAMLETQNVKKSRMGFDSRIRPHSKRPMFELGRILTRMAAFTALAPFHQSCSSVRFVQTKFWKKEMHPAPQGRDGETGV